MITVDDERWNEMVKVAVRLGASHHAVKKWRQRGVPHKWRIAIVGASDGLVRLCDFLPEVVSSPPPSADSPGV